MLQRWILLLLFWCSSYSYANELLLYSPDSEANSTLFKQLHIELNNPKLVSNLSTILNPSIVVGMGNLFAETVPAKSGSISIIILPYLASPPSKPNVYHQYYQVSSNAIYDYLLEQFDDLRVGYIYYEDEDPFDRYNESQTSKIKFIGEKIDKDVFSAVRRLQENKRIDVLMVTNDTRIYTSRNLRFLLEYLYRKSIPVMSLNRKLLAAGAAFSITPELQAFVKDTAEMVVKLKKGEWVNKIQFAQTYRVDINERLISRYALQVKPKRGVK